MISKKTTFALKTAVFTLAAVLALSACVTIPAPQNAEDCLLVLGIIKEGPSFDKAPINELVIKEQGADKQIKTVPLPDKTQGFIVSGLPAGKYALFYTTQWGLWDEKKEVFVANVTLKPGYLTVAPGGLYIRVYFYTDIKKRYEMKPRILTTEDYERIRAELQKDPNFSLWKYQEGLIDMSMPDTMEPPESTDEIFEVPLPEPEPILVPTTSPSPSPTP